MLITLMYNISYQTDVLCDTLSTSVAQIYLILLRNDPGLSDFYCYPS